jgi:hypothetical protein
MRLSAFAVIAASAALVQVSAAPAPIRLLVISPSVEEDSPVHRLRFGHAVPAIASYRNDNGDRDFLDISPTSGSPTLPGNGLPISSDGKPVPHKRFRHRPSCHGKVAVLMHRIKIKAIKFGNCFRKALGWPLIEAKHHHHHHLHGKRPQNGKNEEAGGIRVDGGLVSILPFPGVAAANSGDWAGVSDAEHKHKHSHKHHGSFLSRLHHSLMNLGRWEGRAVAFVIGCGIGVLIRMFWVLAIVSYRTFRGYRDDGYASVTVMEEYDSDDETVISVPISKVEPPKYIYPIDEKST